MNNDGWGSDFGSDDGFGSTGGFGNDGGFGNAGGFGNDDGFGNVGGFDDGSSFGSAGFGEESAYVARTETGNGTRRFNGRMLVAGLLGALVGSLVAYGVYQSMAHTTQSNAVPVGMVFAILSLFILGACVACEMLQPRLCVFKELQGKDLCLVPLFVLLFFGLGCGIEFLYELGNQVKPVVFDDFIFVIDDSGSMNGTDPTNLRYDAFNAVVEQFDEDKRASLIRFTEEITGTPVALDYLTDLQKASLYASAIRGQTDGGTNIQLALSEALDLYEQNRIAGRNAVIVLLSDGGGDVKLHDVADACADLQVAITTVSLGGGADRGLLSRLAQATGGMYLDVKSADELVDAFSKVNVSVQWRYLFAPRPVLQRNAIAYVLARVLFLTLPGVLLGVAFMTLFRVNGVQKQIAVSVAGAFASACVMELGTYMFWNAMTTCLISWLCYGIVVLWYTAYERKDFRPVGMFGSADKKARKKGASGRFTQPNTYDRQDIQSDEMKMFQTGAQDTASPFGDDDGFGNGWG